MPDLSLQELSQQLREAENPAHAHIELILDYGAQGEEIRPEEIRKAEANEAEANRQIARRKDIQADEIPKTPEIPGIPRQGVGMG